MKLSRFTGRAHKHEGKLIVLIVLLSWRWDLPIVLYPGAPPQYRSGVSQLPTSQPLKQGYIVTETATKCILYGLKGASDVSTFSALLQKQKCKDDMSRILSFLLFFHNLSLQKYPF
jgi:hypothetical protein